MKTAGCNQREKPACALKQAPVPEAYECPACGYLVEIWSDEGDAACSSCGKTLSRAVND